MHMYAFVCGFVFKYVGLLLHIRIMYITYAYMYRMHNNRKIMELMFGRMEDTNKRGRLHREWLDDIIK